jgi:prepilin-type N-terminal cleavage/methylation domain-containing protein
MDKTLLRKPGKASVMWDQKGFTLIEVLIAVLLTAIIAIGIFVGLRTIILLYGDTNTHEIAKDMAASGMDDIMSQPYANTYTIFSPTSGPVGTVITIPSGAGWTANDTISGVTVGGTNAAYSLTVNSSGNLTGTITVPSISSGAQTIVITGANSGAEIFTGVFAVTNASTASQYPGEYSNYQVVLVKPVSLEVTEQQITINILFNGNIIYALTDYRTNY